VLVITWYTEPKLGLGFISSPNPRSWRCTCACNLRSSCADRFLFSISFVVVSYCRVALIRSSPIRSAFHWLHSSCRQLDFQRRCSDLSRRLLNRRPIDSCRWVFEATAGAPLVAVGASPVGACSPDFDAVAGAPPVVVGRLSQAPACSRRPTVWLCSDRIGGVLLN
jgi:hypothetical protein